MKNKINSIKDIETRKQVTEICKRLQILKDQHNYTAKQIDDLIQNLNLPLWVHLFITGYYSELMTYKYN